MEAIGAEEGRKGKSKGVFVGGGGLVGADVMPCPPVLLACSVRSRTAWHKVR
jgi:hypothetical protein